MSTDFYALLGVSRDADSDTLKKAYRRRARELHPDANPDDPEAEERFKQVSRAYEVLSDPDTRARYDRFGEAGLAGAASGGDPFAGGFTDIFDAFFGGNSPFGGSRAQSGPPRGQDLEAIVEVTLEQAVRGARVPVDVRTALRCDECNGSGAGSGTQPVTCSECNGAGQVQQMRQSVLGRMVTTSPCRRCDGIGRVVVTPCSACGGEGRLVSVDTCTFDMPAGVETGTTMRLPGRGAVGRRGGGAGDLYVHIQVLDDERFVREGDDLVALVHVGIAQAALGTHVVLDTFDGEVDLVIPPGTQHGREFVSRGKGVPHLNGRGRGHLRARVLVHVPTELSEDEERLLRALAGLRQEAVASEEKGFFSKIKSAFS